MMVSKGGQVSEKTTFSTCVTEKSFSVFVKFLASIREANKS